MKPSLPHLSRRWHPAGHPTWVWSQDDRSFDLEAAGFGEDLAEVASWLHGGEEERAGLLSQAEPVEVEDWPWLRPGRPGKALCLGKNFAAHAREFGSEPPEELIWFAKLPDVLIGPGEPVRIPSWLETRVDPEAELVILVGSRLENATIEEAEAAIAAWTLGNDVTARKQQGEDRKRGWPWLRCKNLGSFGPIGPGWVPATSLGDFRRLELLGSVNGEVRQRTELSHMLWPPAEALAEISRWTPLCPGDLIFLGTPAGVSEVAPGDRLSVAVEGLGVLENPVESA